jgi:hypothetical protein
MPLSKLHYISFLQQAFCWRKKIYRFKFKSRTAWRFRFASFCLLFSFPVKKSSLVAKNMPRKHTSNDCSIFCHIIYTYSHYAFIRREKEKSGCKNFERFARIQWTGKSIFDHLKNKIALPKWKQQLFRSIYENFLKYERL